MTHPLAPPTSRRPAPHRRSDARRQQGSAYLVTLLSLVVLTMLALALTFATQTEMLVGSNERTLQRVFYGAESSVHIAAAGILEHNKCIRGLNFQDVPAGKPGWLARSWLEYDPIFPVAAPWCNLCSVNDVDEYTSNAFFKVNHQIEARAVLLMGSEEGARKTISDMIDVQPWQDFKPPLDEFCLDEIKDNQTDKNKPGI